MNRATVAAVGILGAILLTGCTGRIDFATNVTQVAATLNVSFTCTQGEAGGYWLEHRRVGATARVERNRAPQVQLHQRGERAEGLSAHRPERRHGL